MDAGGAEEVEFTNCGGPLPDREEDPTFVELVPLSDELLLPAEALVTVSKTVV